MVCAISPPFSALSLQRLSVRNATSYSSKPQKITNKPVTALPGAVPSGRRQLLLLLTASAGLAAKEAVAEDIPLFGIRKSLKRVEEEAEEIVREGFEAADKGLESAEKGLETAERGLEAAEKGIETAEREITSAVSFGDLAQAGVVAGAEFLGVLVATAVVNGILGPEAQKSS
ncbi:hypothetical protein HN51_068536 [Arachis hypogaea]|uniref:Synechocystis YCF37 n=2 Tax=Arachis TaxID=3817 RepID=A0A444Z9Z6_ARAHY|nr:uncharacterized protein LOC107487913 [Arachis duranensis]XP_016201780.1 uncharacterized protein LOC107642817 [Arachis ipaensis]XP_025652858.1 uncharacterized protein LOC112748829 [Arachis hypogaea]RYR11001.1 hypothetical protein Ahy_B05g079495 [Arachis hypogaea]